MTRQPSKESNERVYSTVGLLVYFCRYENARGEVTSQSLRSRYDRHIVGKTRFNALIAIFGYNTIKCVEIKNGNDLSCYSIKLNQLVYENVHMITDLPTKHI